MADVMARHTCHAVDCDRPCPPRMLMDREHWAMVPADRQRAVLDAYRPGQEWLNPRPSTEWLTAAWLAINAVAAAEDKPIPRPWLETEEGG
jgi:hypothetical protein